MAAVKLQETLELVEKLREELDESTDKYEDQIDQLTAEFEDKIEELENKCDDQEGKIQAKEKERDEIEAKHAAEVSKMREEHAAAMHALASNSGDAWEKKQDEEGNYYFENKINGETSWEDPRPLNDEGMQLKEKVGELQEQFKRFKKSFDRSKLMQKALREEIDNLGKTLDYERKEKDEIKKTLKTRDDFISEIDSKHEAALRIRAEEEEKREQKHRDNLKHEKNNTLEALRELADMRREATSMMDSMAAELKSTYLAYGGGGK